MGKAEVNYNIQIAIYKTPTLAELQQTVAKLVSKGVKEDSYVSIRSTSDNREGTSVTFSASANEALG